MIQIVPAVLETTEEGYAQTVARLNEAPSLEGATVQIDFADGQFVNNRTVEQSIIKAHPLKYHKEAHLMVKDPLNWLSSLKDLEFKTVLFPIEVDQTEATIDRVRELGMKAGLVLNPETEIEKVRPYVAAVEVIQLMGIHPGEQGQVFMPETLSRVTELVALRQATKTIFQIAVDGGITAEVAALLSKSGVDVLVIGSHLVRGDVEDNLEQVWEGIFDDETN